MEHIILSAFVVLHHIFLFSSSTCIVDNINKYTFKVFCIKYFHRPHFAIFIFFIISIFVIYLKTLFILASRYHIVQYQLLMYFITITAFSINCQTLMTTTIQHESSMFVDGNGNYFLITKLSVYRFN